MKFPIIFLCSCIICTNCASHVWNGFCIELGRFLKDSFVSFAMDQSRSQGSIQMLLSAEHEAQQIVAAARNRNHFTSNNISTTSCDLHFLSFALVTFQWNWLGWSKQRKKPIGKSPTTELKWKPNTKRASLRSLHLSFSIWIRYRVL